MSAIIFSTAAKFTVHHGSETYSINTDVLDKYRVDSLAQRWGSFEGATVSALDRASQQLT